MDKLRFRKRTYIDQGNSAGSQPGCCHNLKCEFPDQLLFSIAFLGPDGVGKSSVINEVQRDLAQFFHYIQRFHLRPHFGRFPRNDIQVNRPHDLPVRGPLSTLVKVLLWWFDCNSYYYYQIIKGLSCRKLIIFDRYVYDLEVDPLRYRYPGPAWLARLLSESVPRPDLIYVLVAEANLIQQRKSEVPLDETQRQLELYRTYANLYDFIIIDTQRPLEHVVGEIIATTLEALAKRV